MQTLSEKISWFVVNFTVSLLGVIAVDGTHLSLPTPPPSPPPIVNPTPPPPTPPPAPIDPELVGVQVPIPKDMRVYNRSGNCCVWATIQALGNYNKSNGTHNLIDKYTWATGPGEVNRVLTQKGVKFLQTTSGRRDYSFLKKWVTEEKKGVGVGLPGHMVLMCHFDEGKEVKIIDNSDRSLRIQTWTWQQFVRRYDGWALVILPDTSVVPTDWDNNVDNGRLYHGLQEN